MFGKPLLSQNRKVGSSGVGAGSTLIAPVATTSGTTADVSGIPSNAKEVVITIDNLSTSGTSNLELKLGTGSGIDEGGSTSYLGRLVRFTATQPVSSVWPTDAVTVADLVGASRVLDGAIVLTLHDETNNIWKIVSNITKDITNTYLSIGSKTLDGALTQFRLTMTNGTDTFDLGSVGALVKT